MVVKGYRTTMNPQNGREDDNGGFEPRMIKSGDQERFMFAGNAYFTLRSMKTGTRYTYRISRAFDEKTVDGETVKVWKDLWFVSLLTGPDNWANYTYIGVCGVDHAFRTTGKSKLPLESAPVMAFTYTLNHLHMGKDSVPGVEIWHAGKCGKCGKKLTVPESIDAGYGPDCLGRLGE